MDLTNRQIHLVGYISTVEQSRNRANSIIALAENNHGEAETLAACATILLAAALEQGIESILTDAGESESAQEGIDVELTKQAPFFDESLWWRVQSLPSLLSDGRFRLNFQHAFSKSLRALITNRNKLVHIKETAVHIIGPNDQLKIENNQIVATLRVPKNPWGSITLERAKEFREAVDVYFREVLFPASGEISAGTIVIPAVA